MNNFNFGEVLTRAWQNIWKHKVLWIFGILASCARSNGGGGNGGGGNRSYQTNPGGNTPFSGSQIERVINQAGHYFGQHIWIIIAIGCALILFAFISFALGMMGRICLIKGTFKAENGAEKLAFGEIWSESMPYFGRIFGLNFLIGLAVFAVILIPLILMGVVAATGGMASRATAVIGLVCLLPIICILIPIGWVLAVVIEQAQAAIVLEDLGMLDGFKRGWQIVKSNVGPMVVMTLILGIGGAILGVVVALPLIVAFIPIFISIGTLRQSLTPVYISLACCAVYVPVLIFFNGVLTAYIQSVWALTFLRLAKPKEDSPALIEANA